MEDTYYTLIDAAEEHKKHPKGFAIPTFAEIRKVKKGDYVKIGVRFDRSHDDGADQPQAYKDWVRIIGEESVKHAGGEKFWVKLDLVKGNNLVGSINNDLVFTRYHGLKDDGVIEFQRKHILAIE